MTINQVYDQISKNYAVGIIAFYGKQSPDPWQETLNEWAKEVLSMQGIEAQQQSNVRYLEKFLKLINEFKMSNTRPHAKVADAFFNHDRYQKFVSVRKKICFDCGFKQDLKIKTDKETNHTYLVCKECEKKNT